MTKRVERMVKKARGAKPRILMWDIEAEDLKADWGEMICYAVKPLGEEPWTVSTLGYRKRGYLDWDKRVVERCAKELSEADVVVTWYGQGYDFRFLRARCAYYDVRPPPPNIAHIDLWKTARFQLALSSNRLNNVEDFLQLPHRKTPLLKDVWRKARRGHKASIKEVVSHCVADVVVLEEAYLRLRPFIKQHPNVNLMVGERHSCPKCGAGQEYVEAAGWHYATTRAYLRVRCRACRSWSRYRASEPGGAAELR